MINVIFKALLYRLHFLKHESATARTQMGCNFGQQNVLLAGDVMSTLVWNEWVTDLEITEEIKLKIS